MATALFVLGKPGSGKSYFTNRFIKERLKHREAWCVADKDITGACLSHALMKSLGLNPYDKDSPQYKKHVRDLEYQSALDVACEQLKLGINVILPGPWTKEVNNGFLFDLTSLKFPKETKLAHIYIDLPNETIKQRIIKRNKPRDYWKLKNWEEFEKNLIIPPGILQNNVIVIDGTKSFRFQKNILNV